LLRERRGLAGLRLMAPSHGCRCGRSGGDLPGRRRSSGAPWNGRPRRRDARKTPKRLESLPAPRRKPSWCTRCASKCFSFPPRDIPWASQTAAGTRLDDGRPGKSVKEAIRAAFFRAVLIPSELPLRHPRQARPASTDPPSLNTWRNFCMLRRYEPVAGFIFGSSAGGTNQTTRALPRPTTRVLTIPRPPTCKWHPADV
jgi:hypothetical protein